MICLLMADDGSVACVPSLCYMSIWGLAITFNSRDVALGLPPVKVHMVDVLQAHSVSLRDSAATKMAMDQKL